MSHRSRYCSVYGCLNSSVTMPDLTFFKLPQDSERRALWLRLIAREDLPSDAKWNTVCQVHFNAADILPGTTRSKLKRCALPQLYLPTIKEDGEIVEPEAGSTETEPVTCVLTGDTETQTSPPASPFIIIKTEPEEYDVSEKRRKLDDSSLKELEMFDDLCDTLLTEDMAQLAKAQAYLKSHIKDHNHNNSKDFMNFSMNLYSTNPEAYRLLQSTLGLPNSNDLHRHYIPLKTDLNKEIMSVLKTKVESMTEMDKYCSVILDIISLEPALFYNEKEDKISGFHEIGGVQSTDTAKQILVAMTRGLFSDWKHPVAYALLSDCPNYDDVSKWIDKLLKKLLDIGYNVKTVVSDMGSILYKAAQKRSISAFKPYSFLNQRKIYHIFDVPGLIKLIRNNFLHYDFHFHDEVAKFDHVLQFYNQDKEKRVRIAPKLSDSHVNPSNSEKDKLELATQLLSRSVATGISTYVNFNQIVDTARGTVHFINMMNNSFDVLNSSNLINDHEYRMPYCANQSQIALFQEMLSILKNLKAIHPKNGSNLTVTMKFIEGIQITINAVMKLFNDLKSKGFTTLQTRRLNKEAMDNCFSQIKTGQFKPTCKNFLAALHKSFFLNVTKASKGSKKVGLDEILNQARLEALNNVTPSAQYKLNLVADSYEYSSEIASSDYNRLEIPKENSLVYICGHLLRKCVVKHECPILKSYVRPTEETINTLKTDTTYLKYMSFTINMASSLIAVPSDDFIRFVERLEIIFRSTFENKYTNYEIVKTMYANMQNIDMCTCPCPCFPLKYLKLLFIRMRIFSTIKHSNNELRTCGSNMKKFFSVPNICGPNTQ